MGSGDSYEGQWERDLIHGKVRAELSVSLLTVSADKHPPCALL